MIVGENEGKKQRFSRLDDGQQLKRSETGSNISKSLRSTIVGKIVGIPIDWLTAKTAQAEVNLSSIEAATDKILCSSTFSPCPLQFRSTPPSAASP